MGGRTPDHTLTEDYTHSIGPYDNYVLKAGYFVRPIHWDYLPKHIMESAEYRHANPKQVVFCYCHFGIIPIPLKILRKV